MTTSQPTHNQGSLRAYTIGFFLSIGLTVAAYFAVVHHLFANSIVPILIGLAFVQLWVQLLFFLHLDRENKPRWNLMIFLLSFSVVAILVVGSLWIMNHLNYNMLSGHAANTYIIHDEGITP